MKFLTNIGTSALLALTLAAVVALSGCSGSNKTLVVPDPSATIGLPTPSAAGPVNTYTGTQTPGEWSFTLDNTNGKFSYQPVTYSATATSGTTQLVNGFTVLSNGGLALEVEGRAAILLPGDSTNAPVFGVPQTECYPITGRLRFQYLGSIGQYGTGGGELPYGGIVASTDTTGASWAFEDLEGNYGTGPASFSTTCSTSSNLSTIGFSGTKTLLNDEWFQNGQLWTTSAPTANTQSNIWIGPTGFFVADQSDPTYSTPTGSSVVGVAEPSSALTTSDIASTSKSYLGFIYEPGNTGHSIPTSTVPVSFTGQASAGLSGEEYLNNNVTQTLDPTTAMSISLGKQDSTYNGRYTSVSITVLDPNQGCTTAGKGTAGVNADGYIICTFSGTAMVGNPGGKYAIFINAINYATTKYAVPPQAMNIYLFQQ
jgi:hypothetical protein